MKRITTVVLAVLSLQTAWADNKTLTLQQCLDMAVENSLELQTADKQAERTRILLGTAWDVDKTSLSLSQDPTSGGSPDNALTLSQTIEFPTLYAARRSRLKAETRAEESRREVVANRLKGEVAAAYWQLVYLTERMAILNSQDTLLARYVTIASRRCAAGEARRLELLSAERMHQDNLQELATIGSEQAIARRTLMTLLCTDNQIVPADSHLKPVSAGSLGYDYGQSAEGKYASLRLKAAEKAITEEKNGFAPSLSIGLRTQMVISGWDPYHENRARYAGGNFMGFEVGVGIPLFWGATRAKVKAAKAERDVLLLENRRQQQLRSAEYKAATDRFSAAQTKMEYYEKTGVSKADELARLATTEYENGEISYVEYVNALQESMDLRLKRAAAINDFNQAAVTLWQFEGKL